MVVNEKYKKIISSAVSIIAILGILIMVGTVVWASAYTVPVSDDFWHAKYTGIKQVGLWERIVASWKYVVYNYITHQGAYSIFFCSFFNPLTTNLFINLRVFMLVNAINYFFSVILLVVVLYRSVIKENRAILYVLIFCIIFPITQYDAFQETFYWFTGCTNYSFPMSFANYLFVALIVLNESTNKKIISAMTVIGCICGFLLEGGVLSIGGTMCALIFIVIVYFRIKTGKFNWQSWLIFGVTLVFGIINLLSPGNYARSKTETSGALDFLKSLYDTWLAMGNSYRWIFVRTNYVYVLLVFTICGIILAKKIDVNEKAYVICTIISGFVPILIIFPVCFGYNVPWMPNRCVFIMTSVMSFIYGNCAFMLGVVVGRHFNAIAKKVILVAFCVVAVLGILFCQYNYKEYIVAKVAHQLYNHEIQDWYYNTKDMIEDFDEKQGQDVVVDVPTDPNALRNYYCFFVLNEEDNQVNQGVAWAFNLKSIRSSRENGE